MGPPGRRAPPRRAVAAALVGVAAAAASAAAVTTAATVGGGAALAPFGSCGELLRTIRAEALSRVTAFGLDRGTGGLPLATPGDGSSRRIRNRGARAVRRPVPGADFSDTNTQVEGVAEADIVKTDGEVVYALRGQTLRVVQTTAGGAGGVEAGVLRLPEWPSEMLLGEGGRLLVMASSYGELVPTPTPTPFVAKPPPPVAVDVDEPAASPADAPEPTDEEEGEAEETGAAADADPAPTDVDAGEGGTAALLAPPVDRSETADADGAAETAAASAAPPPITACPGDDAATDGDVTLPPGAVPTREPRPHQGPITIVFTVDASTPSAPALLSVTRLQGQYVSSRSVDGVARLVLSTAPPSNLPYTRPGVRPRPGRNVPGLSEAQAEAANKALVAGTVLEDWFPRFRTAPAAGVRGGVTTGFIAACSATYRPASFSGFSTLAIVTLPLRAGAPGPSLGRGTAVFAGGDTVYSSVGSVYVTTTNYRERRPIRPFGSPVAPPIADGGASYNTSIHQFGVDNGTVGATYLGTGVVGGSVLNQFSMHETAGTFFIATTLGAPWWRARNTSVSQITAFRRADGAPADGPSPLVAVGQVGDLGRGERIYAVRYVDDVAYVVTFRQVDPLYIISLADPTALVATGELKIPGYSSYLHPLGEGRLLGVGQDANATTGRTTGVKVTLFDVADVAAPREVATWTEPVLASASSVEWDHRAFLYWAPARLAVLPIRSYGRDSFTGSVVLRLGAARITEVGRITHERPAPFQGGGPTATESISRNLVLGRQWLWSLSGSRFQVQALDGLAVSGSVVFSPTPTA
ncbi:hypothetical protein I4F81_002091 [Pyropia yezoensis]|uniref:Uncharacterized protein n=1 Tax=Pyropia yezoensis TaxID=2788 RepID=A0ACC3BP28_PYRYE|nr:hypothetical protein I4F81_002091 [Neopyropia yezoensis]